MTPWQRFPLITIPRAWAHGLSLKISSLHFKQEIAPCLALMKRCHGWLCTGLRRCYSLVPFAWLRRTRVIEHKHWPYFKIDWNYNALSPAEEKSTNKCCAFNKGKVLAVLRWWNLNGIAWREPKHSDLEKIFCCIAVPSDSFLLLVPQVFVYSMMHLASSHDAGFTFWSLRPSPPVKKCYWCWLPASNLQRRWSKFRLDRQQELNCMGWSINFFPRGKLRSLVYTSPVGWNEHNLKGELQQCQTWGRFEGFPSINVGLPYNCCAGSG